MRADMRVDMGGDRRGRGVRGGVRRAAAAVLALGLLALTGCASMPGTGPVQRVDSSQRAEGDSQVRVFGVSPKDGALPQEIVRGFLEAVTSDEADFDTARQYLTSEQRRAWDPFAGVTVLAAGPDIGAPRTDAGAPTNAETFQIDLTGRRLAVLNGSYAYAPVTGPYQGSMELVQVGGEWRISALPDGLVMREADFRRIYRSVNTFYYADLGLEADRLRGVDVLVADPIFVRRRIDPVSEILQALIHGPSAWLDPVVRTAFPSGVALVDGSVVTDDSGALTVRVADAPAISAAGCREMAAQLLHTVQEVASAEVTEVRIATRRGAEMCVLTWAEAESRAPGRLDGDVEHPYFLDHDRRLVAVSNADAVTQRVTGPFGQGEQPLRSAAVSRNEVLAAGVSDDGSELYVTRLAGSDPLAEPVYVSGSSGPDAGLSPPTWDGLGDLWVADRDPDRPRLLRLSGGRGEPAEIPVVGLSPSQRVESLRVASDGVRIALLISQDGQTTLQLGRVERTGSGTDLRVRVAELRPVAPQLDQVAAASWAGDSRLVIVGRPTDGVEQLQYVATDGSFATTTIPGLNNLSGIAATEDDTKPLLAETANGIARLEQDAQWKLVPDTENSTSPFYPG